MDPSPAKREMQERRDLEKKEKNDMEQMKTAK